MPKMKNKVPYQEPVRSSYTGSLQAAVDTPDAFGEHHTDAFGGGVQENQEGKRFG